MRCSPWAAAAPTASARRCAGSGWLADEGGSAEGPPIDSDRVISDLRELDRRTGGTSGAQRLCWGEEWRAAREYLIELLAEIGLEAERDEAGNLWAYLEGDAEPALTMGSHLDSVPNGGWLDGALGVMTGLGVLRAWARSGTRPPRTLALVDFADEEGARFGRSLYGSSAVDGSFDPAELADLRDGEGRPATAVLEGNDIDVSEARSAAERLERVASYVELHIEQGPVLESRGLSAAAVSGCVGVRRRRFRFSGQAAHAGTTPMGSRQDAGLAAAELALMAERITAQTGGVATTGSMKLEPGTATVVPGNAEVTIDLRHPQADALEEMVLATRTAATEAARSRGCGCTEELIWEIEPIGFDPDLVARARAVCLQVGGSGDAMVSGALHDAAEIARVRPAAMIFTASAGGISHADEEDTAEADLRAGIEAFGLLAARSLAP